MRQLKRLFLTRQFFYDIFSNSGHFNLHLDEVNDWKIRNFYFDGESDGIWVVIESFEFQEIPEGEVIPQLYCEINIRRVTYEAA